MQPSLDLGGAAELADVRAKLKPAFQVSLTGPKRTPVGQLVKSLISSRTRDQVSLRAYERLVRRYPQWRQLAATPPQNILAVIADVTFAEVKAENLVRSLQRIAVHHPDYRLDFLKDLPTDQALAWLERLPGVGRKVAASTLNFSTLHLPAFVVDTHVLRVLRRIGFVGQRAPVTTAYHAVMSLTTDWQADDHIELHALLKRLGQTFCRPHAQYCSSCPLRQRCLTARRSRAP